MEALAGEVSSSQIAEVQHVCSFVAVAQLADKVVYQGDGLVDRTGGGKVTSPWQWRHQDSGSLRALCNYLFQVFKNYVFPPGRYVVRSGDDYVGMVSWRGGSAGGNLEETSSRLAYSGDLGFPGYSR